MGFESLLGNERLRENLRRSINRGRISHFYLICGPAGSGKRTLARLLAAAILCRGSEKPCGSCPACRKVLSGSHPDFITVDDPEKKTVTVDLVRRAREDVYIRPNEAGHKIYLFPRAQDMGIPGQNALLKVLEEPPKHGVFILLTDNPEKLLPTVRSRCTELKLQALPDPLLRDVLAKEFPQAAGEALTSAIGRSGGFLGQARELLEQGSQLPEHTVSFLQAYRDRSAHALVQILVPMEKWKRDVLTDALRQWISLLEAALVYRSGVVSPLPYVNELSLSRSPQELMRSISHLQTAIEYAQGNVSPAAICGWLVWVLL